MSFVRSIPPDDRHEGRVSNPSRSPATYLPAPELDPDDYENCNNVYGDAPMSMVTCFDCSTPIDSDDDPECFVEVGNMRRLHQTMVLCENCRGRREDQIEYEMSIAS